MPTKSERTRRRIVDAANQLFYRKGFNRTSFSDVVEEAGVPRGNIYYYFKTKDAMLRAVIRHRLETIATMLGEWDRQIQRPLDRLERFVQIINDTAPMLLRSGCPMGSLNIELGKEPSEMKAEAKRLFDLFEQWLTRQFTEMGYPDEARDLTLQLMARGQGIIVITQVYQDAGFLARGAAEINRWLEELDRYA